MTTGALAGKVAAVTGATSGSGRAIAERFLAEGAHVALLARGKERLDEVTEQLGDRAVPLATDVADPASVHHSFEQIAAKFGRLDILVNNAAVYRPCAVEHLSDYDIERQVGTNFLGPVYTSRAAIPLMKAAGCGDIVNTSSESTLHPFPMLSMYVSTKAALEAFGKVLAQEVRDDDIRVTTVVQGTAQGTGGGSTDWEWDPEHLARAYQLWTDRGLLNEVHGKHGGQEPDAIAEVHLFIVTRPRSQKLDTVYCRSF